MDFLHDFFMGTTKADSAAEIFGMKHLLWLFVPLVIIASLYFLFKKHKRAGEVTLLAFAITLLTLRFIKYVIFYPNIWGEGWDRLIPYELCTISSYILPFTVFFKTKRLNAYLYPLAIMGGFITLVYSEWIFNGYALDFNKLESLIVHILLIAIPFVSSAIGIFQFDFKKIYQPFLALIVLVLYAFAANTWITPGSNHMYLKDNPLPFKIEPFHHLFTFGLIFFLLLAVLYLPNFIKWMKERKKISY